MSYLGDLSEQVAEALKKNTSELNNLDHTYMECCQRNGSIYHEDYEDGDFAFNFSEPFL